MLQKNKYMLTAGSAFLIAMWTAVILLNINLFWFIVDTKDGVLLSHAVLVILFACFAVFLLPIAKKVLMHFASREPVTHLMLSYSVMIAIFLIAFSILIVRTYALGPVFTLDSSSSEATDTEDLEMADLDGDGDLDYVNGQSTSNNLEVYLNNGAGTFSHSTLLTGGAYFTLGDVDNDEDIDIVASSGGPGSNVHVYKNNGSGSFSYFSTFIVNLPGTCANQIKLSDVNLDGDLDVIIGKNCIASPDAVYLNDSVGNFIEAESPIPMNISFSLADFNADGHLDLAALRGGSFTSVSSTIFLNSGTGMFTTIAWHTEHGNLNANDIKVGDFNSDGNIDYAVSVLSSPEKMHVYLNDGTGTSFSLVQYTVDGGGANPAIADIDNNGSHDIIAALSAGSGNGGSEVWINNGSASFTYGSSAAETNDVTTRAVIGDIDGDTDLDYITGARSVLGSPNYTRRYKSNQSTILPNTAPSPPTSGFSASRVLNGPNVDLTLVWGAGSDAQTTTAMLQYAVKVGTVSGGQNIVSAASASPHYVNRILPSSKSKELLIKNLPCNTTYYWSVAAVDSGLMRGAFSAEYQTVVDAGCNASTSGGGGGGGGSGGNTSVGGGYSRARSPYFIDPPPPPPPPMRTISGEVWMDFNMNGDREDYEEGVEGVMITASDGTKNTTIATDESGRFSFALPARRQGYRITRGEVEGMKSTTDAEVVMVEGEVGFGIAPTLLRAYAPCSRMREGIIERSKGEGTSESILHMLDRTMPPVPSSPLLTRRTMLRLTSSLFCLSGKAKNNLLPRDILKSSDDARLISTFIAHNIPVLKGGTADLNAFARYGELEALLSPLLHANRGESVETIIGLSRQWRPDRTITKEEGVRVLLLAAFAQGAIHLSRGPEVVAAPSHDAVASAAQSARVGRCLTPSGRNVITADLLPGDAEYERLSRLLSLGTGEANDRMFLLGITLSQRGLASGLVSYVPRQTVLWLPFIRTLDIALCSPPESVASLRQAISGIYEAGLKDVVVVPERDAVFGVRTQSYTLAARAGLAASRLKPDGYSTVFSFVRDILATPHDPRQQLSLHDASRMIASAVTTAMIRAGALSPSEGAEHADSLTLDILNRYRGNQAIDERFLRETQFTQEMWVDLLSSLLHEPLSRVRMPPRGMILWNRLLRM